MILVNILAIMNLMKKTILFIFSIITLLSISIYYYHPYKNKLVKNLEVLKTAGIKDCPIFVKKVTVNGLSMYPFLIPKEEIDAIYGYYNCHDVLRNDIVLYKYSGNSNLLIKFIKAIPGDRWKLKKTDNGYEIVVNDNSLLNSEGNTYLISEGSIKMLELYVKDYPIIPKDTYLLLGDKTNGSLDSTSFGLVGKKDIMAKVER